MTHQHADNVKPQQAASKTAGSDRAISRALFCCVSGIVLIFSLYMLSLPFVSWYYGGLYLGAVVPGGSMYETSGGKTIPIPSVSYCVYDTPQRLTWLLGPSPGAGSYPRTGFSYTQNYNNPTIIAFYGPLRQVLRLPGLGTVVGLCLLPFGDSMGMAVGRASSLETTTTPPARIAPMPVGSRTDP